MGQSAILYLNPKWEMENITTVLERAYKEKVNVRWCGENGSGMLKDCFQIHIKDRHIFVSTRSNTPLGIATYLSLDSNLGGIKILRDIADVLGGALIENDCGSNGEEKVEFIDGILSGANGLTFFAQYAILDKGIEQEDYAGFIQVVKEWFKKNPDQKVILP
jgi:hypothetical protein